MGQGRTNSVLGGIRGADPGIFFTIFEMPKWKCQKCIWHFHSLFNEHEMALDETTWHINSANMYSFVEVYLRVIKGCWPWRRTALSECTSSLTICLPIRDSSVLVSHVIMCAGFSLCYCHKLFNNLGNKGGLKFESHSEKCNLYTLTPPLW